MKRLGDWLLEHFHGLDGHETLLVELIERRNCENIWFFDFKKNVKNDVTIAPYLISLSTSQFLLLSLSFPTFFWPFSNIFFSALPIFYPL